MALVPSGGKLEFATWSLSIVIQLLRAQTLAGTVKLPEYWHWPFGAPEHCAGIFKVCPQVKAASFVVRSLALPAVTVMTLPGEGVLAMAVLMQAVGRVAGPSVDPKFATSPDKQYAFSSVVTMKLTPLLTCPFTVTTTLPEVAPVGTVAAIERSLQLVTGALNPLNVTVLDPCCAPKLVPVTVTGLPTAPDVGDRLVMFGNTVKATPLEATPLTDTTTLPVVAPFGTVAAMEVLLQLVVDAVVPLNVTVPEVLKFVPVMVTDEPTMPEVCERLVMFGVRVNVTPLLTIPL